MPIYEYKCEQEHVTDKLVGVSDAPEVIECPVCQKPSSRVPISQTSFELKGTWFKTKGSY